MGRGQNASNSVHSGLSRREAKLNRKVEEMTQYLESISPGLKRVSDLSEQELRIADPDLREANRYNHTSKIEYGNRGATLVEQGVSSYTRLSQYGPKCRGNNFIWPKTDLIFDHESGRIYSVSQLTKYVSKPLAVLNGKDAAVYHVTDCGADIDQALQIAQNEYDQLWSDFRKAKPQAHHVEPFEGEKWGNMSGVASSSNVFEDQFFLVHRDELVENFKAGLKEKIRFDDYLAKKREEDFLLEQEERKLKARVDALGYEIPAL